MLRPFCLIFSEKVVFRTRMRDKEVPESYNVKPKLYGGVEINAAEEMILKATTTAKFSQCYELNPSSGKGGVVVSTPPPPPPTPHPPCTYAGIKTVLVYFQIIDMREICD